MSLYLLRRVLYTLPILLGVSLVCFSFIYLAPGDPISAVLPEQASAETVRRYRHDGTSRRRPFRQRVRPSCSRPFSSSPTWRWM